MSKQTVYVVTGFVEDWEERGIDSPFDEYFTDTRVEAEDLRAFFLISGYYDDVSVSGPEEREVVDE